MKNGQFKAWNKMSSARQFVERSIRSHFPANSFIIIDTHADTHTGELQWGVGADGAYTAPASNLLDNFCGSRFLKTMQAASNEARAFTAPTDPGWYNNSPTFRGGWRGLFVASCAPAIRVANGFNELKRLVVE